MGRHRGTNCCASLALLLALGVFGAARATHAATVDFDTIYSCAADCPSGDDGATGSHAIESEARGAVTLQPAAGTPIPEPAAALLFALGSMLVLSWARSRSGF